METFLMEIGYHLHEFKGFLVSPNEGRRMKFQRGIPNQLRSQSSFAWN